MKLSMTRSRRVSCSFLSLAILLALSGCASLREAPDTDTYIFLEPEETLYVRFSLTPDLRLETRYPSMADALEERRYEQFFSAMRALSHVYRFPMEMHLLEKFEKPGDGPLLDIHAIRWEQEYPGEISVVVRARLERYGALNTLGVFKERGMAPALSTFERTEEAFARAMEDALSQMFLELDNHFETPDEEAYVEEPLGP